MWFSLFPVNTQTLWNQKTKSHLLESNEDKSVLHEVLVVEKGLKEVSSPGTSGSDGSVMTVGSHVRSDEHLVEILACGVGAYIDITILTH